MEGIQIKEETFQMKGRLDLLEAELENQISELKMKEEEWREIDGKAELLKLSDIKVRFNISGRIFMTSLITLLDTKDTFFYKLILSGKVNLLEEIFIDRDYKYFEYILNFLRTKQINLKRFSILEFKDFKLEAEFYEISEVLKMMGDSKDVEIKDFECKNLYPNDKVRSTKFVSDLHDKSGNYGICSNTPGLIIFELFNELEIKKIDIMGYKGASGNWSNENGVGANIYFSVNKEEWIRVDTIPSGFGAEIKSINLEIPKLAKFIKFEHNSLLGIGYLNIEKA